MRAATSRSWTARAWRVSSANAIRLSSEKRIACRVQTSNQMLKHSRRSKKFLEKSSQLVEIVRSGNVDISTERYFSPFRNGRDTKDHDRNVVTQLCALAYAGSESDYLSVWPSYTNQNQTGGPTFGSVYGIIFVSGWVHLVAICR